MFDILKPQSYSLSQLNLSWNSAYSSNPEVQGQFEKKLADFVRHSKTLQHLDISGMGFKESTLKYIALWGLRKSKTLLAVHMSGNFQNHELLVKMRTWLKVVHISHKSGVDEEDEPPITKKAKSPTAPTHEYKSYLHVRARRHLKEEYKDQLAAEDKKKYHDTHSAKLDKILRQNRF